jgi:uncharacterized protein YrrD
MNDLGDPIAYEVLERHTPVFSSDGEQVGTVHEILADQNLDIFDGLMISHHLRHRYVAADDIDSLYEHGVVLALTAEQAANLPESRR